MVQPYQYAFTLHAHSSDVRHLAAPSPGVPLLLSASRDGSACLWGPSSGGGGAAGGGASAGWGTGGDAGSSGEWDVKLRVEGPEKRFVSCVGMVRAQGEAFLILGASNGVLSTFILPSATSPPPPLGAAQEPFHTLIEHKQNLCCLDTSKNGLIATGSWDKTVRVWKDFKVAFTIEEHEQSVWSVRFIGEEKLLTAAADNTIKLHSLDIERGASKVIRTFQGHTQPVRGLSLTPDGKGFWSCANDGLVNLYTFDKTTPVQSLSGHTSFVYSVTALPDGSGAISSGEDGTMRVWSNTELLQTIPHPATSLWSTTVVSSGQGPSDYIVLSANDGQIRFFTRDPALAAAGAIKEGWDKEVSSRQLDKSQVGDVKHSDLPGMEALGREGKKDGQVIMIKNNDKVEAYQGESTWQQIGQVVDAVGSGRRQLHEGQEYDYVFDVDVAEGMPPLKLPFNVSENPWIAAQRFLTKHDLPDSYAEQVVEFIHKNTQGVQLGTGDQSAYADPFTGASRYTGASGSGGSSGGDAGGFSGDPFTGQGAYSTTPRAAPAVKGVLPVTTYLSFKQMNVAAAKQKIASLNAEHKALDNEDMANLEQVYAFLSLPAAKLPSATSESASAEEEYDATVFVRSLSKFAEAQRFPLIDIARCLAALSPAFANAPELLTSLLAAAGWGSAVSDKPKETNALLVLRALANLASTATGRTTLGDAAKGLLGELEAKGDWKGVGKGRMPAATLALNYSIMAVKGELPKDAAPALLALIVKILENETSDNETVYRAGIALGNLLKADGYAGGLQVGQVQSAKSLLRTRADALGEKRLSELAAELERIVS